MEYERIKKTMDRQKRIALVAHDNKKMDLVEWCKKHEDTLKQHFLMGTGTTSRLIAEATGLPVRAFKSGPLGGDQQIGARIAEGLIDMLIFFWDPLEAQPHDPDVKALLRIAAVYDIPIANNRATADFIMASKHMNQEYTHEVCDYNKLLSERVAKVAEEK
ncbi:methylglyoxal synthase [Clostridium aminobutyricum]|uniref:Methylglyoxal synthase n=1 Tax=Clostridium aminobutyricum TaxID=33953 RepID=A0A939D9D4_CLOAM|nr:methylglyoxal synthase [Clostridium aminobutyricum]MBN7773844.1 methylglyoxal synthase [Clostridium aminobutyricum]